MICTKLHNSVKDVPPRGGASMCENDDYIVIFGGADREQASYQDIMAWKKTSSTSNTAFSRYNAVKGDIPMPRSGHTIVGYGPFVFLFGGIDFAEEAIYNDTYLLDTRSWEWHYVGEAGCEVPARNSHSFALLQTEGENAGAVLVIFGGASPERGPMADCYYAVLPAWDAIDTSSIYLHWHELSLPLSPPAREMHSTSCHREQMTVIGGRGAGGELLSDVWRLSLQQVQREEQSAVLTWEELSLSSLPQGRCAHTSAYLSPLSSSPSSSSVPSLCLYGGFTEGGVSTDFLVLERGEGWRTLPSPLPPATPLPMRFGHTMCSISSSALQAFCRHSLYGKVLQREVGEERVRELAGDGGRKQEEGETEHVVEIEREGQNKHIDKSINQALLLFGGVNAEQDLGDLWLILYPTPR